MANEQNLIPGQHKLTVEEASRGGKNSAKARSIKAREKEEWADLLSLPMKDGEVDDLTSLAGAKGANLTVSKAMKAKIVTEVLKGNLRAYELLLRCVGMDEPEPQEPAQGQSSGFVEALNRTAEEVWANEAPEKE